MKKDDEYFKKRMLDLANMAYERGICTFSDFLNTDELSLFYSFERELSFVNFEIFGGYEAAERVLVRFGDLQASYPLAYIHISPLLKKFSDRLEHRDFLGALMNLGIKREVLGDLIIQDNEAYLICLESISSFIMEELTRIKHTVVKCNLVDSIPDEGLDRSVIKDIIIPSFRLDAVISEVYKLSRKSGQEAISLRKVFVNNRLCENNSHILKVGDSITLRGKGKFIILNEGKATRSGKIKTSIKLY